MNNFFLISGIIFLTIAVIGQSKLLFLEINPGCFGRLLALVIGVFSLSMVISQGVFTIPYLDLLRSIAQNITPLRSMINQTQLFDWITQFI